MTLPVRDLDELRAVLATTADTALVMLPAAIVRGIIADMDAVNLLVNVPGAMTVNCVRGTVRCTERERIEADRDAARVALSDMQDGMAGRGS